MTLRTLASLAFAAMALCANAGTIVFDAGNPVRVDNWSVSWLGSLLGTTHSYMADYPVTGSVYVIDFSGDFHHSHWAAVPGSPPIPEAGETNASALTTGDAVWCFEYIPDYPGDVPSGTYHADVQFRGKAETYLTVRSMRFGGAADVYASISGPLTNIIGSTASVSAGPGRDDVHDTTSGYPNWLLDTTDLAFTFSWDALSGKWLGTPVFYNAGSTQIDSSITISTLNQGFTDITYQRQFQVLRVRTPSSGSFIFNTAWT